MKFPPDDAFQRSRKTLRRFFPGAYNVGDFLENGKYKSFAQQGIYAFTDPEDKATSTVLARIRAFFFPSKRTWQRLRWTAKRWGRRA
jgi:hypothetical protein